MDPLSDVVSLLRVRATLNARLEAGGDWALRFTGQPDRMKFGVVFKGTCWAVDDDGAPLQRLEAGDCYLIASHNPYALASRPGLTPEDGEARWLRAARGDTLKISAEPDVVVDGGTLDVEEADADLLLRVVPRLLHIHDDADCAATVALLSREDDVARPGAALVRDRLCQVLLVQMLRAHLARGAGHVPGWLGALADPQIGAALTLIHADPRRMWRVTELADAVHLSRSAFAQRFKERVGAAPLEYAQRWRMQQAAAALRRPGAQVTAVAREFGYASHASFSKAYKNVMGVPPSLAAAA